MVLNPPDDTVITRQPLAGWAARLGCRFATLIRERKTCIGPHRRRLRDGLWGRYFLVITLPDGEITYHRPPLSLSDCPA
jgi:hypothetical protein